MEVLTLNWRIWEERSSEKQTWQIGDAWSWLKMIGGDDIMRIGFALVCPAELIPGIPHRHWIPVAPERFISQDRFEYVTNCGVRLDIDLGDLSFVRWERAEDRAA